MAGFKDTIIHDEPVGFWTFDGDPWDADTHQSLNSVIQNEMGNHTHGNIQDRSTVAEAYPYQMGRPGLVELEPQDNYSFVFDYLQNSQKCFIEIQPTVYTNVPNNSYTFEFLFNKKARQYFSPSYLTAPLISKYGMIYIYISTNGSSDFLNFLTPDGENRNDIIEIPYTGYYDKEVHICFTRDVSEPFPNEFHSTESIYFDGSLFYQFTTIYEVQPSVNANTSFYIGGLPTVLETDNYVSRHIIMNAVANHDLFGRDRQTTPLWFDQFAFYNYALSQQQVLNHYKKLRAYDTMIGKDGATYYWPLDDLNSDISNIVHAKIGTRTGTYVGNGSTLFKEQDGPDNLYDQKSVRLAQEAYCYFTGSTYTFSGNFTIEFWFRTNTFGEGILFEAMADSINYAGIIVRINKRNNIASPGSIQVNFTENKYLTSQLVDLEDNFYNFADDNWHHILITRNGNISKLFLDSVEHSTIFEPVVQSYTFSDIILMKAKPNIGSVDGYISKLAIYTKAISEYLIPLRYSYTTQYRLKGVVTLLGEATTAVVRVYNHYTGSLITTVESDPSDGKYEVLLPNNRKVDIMVFDKYDPSVRYRAYGGIVPNELQDLPI